MCARWWKTWKERKENDKNDKYKRNKHFLITKIYNIEMDSFFFLHFTLAFLIFFSVLGWNCTLFVSKRRNKVGGEYGIGSLSDGVFNLENHIHNMKFVFSWCVWALVSFIFLLSSLFLSLEFVLSHCRFGTLRLFLHTCKNERYAKKYFLILFANALALTDAVLIAFHREKGDFLTHSPVT